MEVRFTIRGEPKGKGRPRFCRNTGHAITPKDTVNYETLVRTEYSALHTRNLSFLMVRCWICGSWRIIPYRSLHQKEKGIHAGK
ncbi:MAG: hypothetical protein ACLTC8_10040 [Lachnospiraceae bacterium]